MSSSPAQSNTDSKKFPVVIEGETEYVDESAEFGGPEGRKTLEKKL